MPPRKKKTSPTRARAPPRAHSPPRKLPRAVERYLPLRVANDVSHASIKKLSMTSYPENAKDMRISKDVYDKVSMFLKRFLEKILLAIAKEKGASDNSVRQKHVENALLKLFGSKNFIMEQDGMADGADGACTTLSMSLQQDVIFSHLFPSGRLPNGGYYEFVMDGEHAAWSSILDTFSQQQMLGQPIRPGLTSEEKWDRFSKDFLHAPRTLFQPFTKLNEGKGEEHMDMATISTIELEIFQDLLIFLSGIALDWHVFSEATNPWDIHRLFKNGMQSEAAKKYWDMYDLEEDAFYWSRDRMDRFEKKREALHRKKPPGILHDIFEKKIRNRHEVVYKHGPHEFLREPLIVAEGDLKGHHLSARIRKHMKSISKYKSTVKGELEELGYDFVVNTYKFYEPDEIRNAAVRGSKTAVDIYLKITGKKTQASVFRDISLKDYHLVRNSLIELKLENNIDLDPEEEDIYTFKDIDDAYETYNDVDYANAYDDGGSDDSGDESDYHNGGDIDVYMDEGDSGDDIGSVGGGGGDDGGGGGGDVGGGDNNIGEQPPSAPENPPIPPPASSPAPSTAKKSRGGSVRGRGKARGNARGRGARGGGARGGRGGAQRSSRRLRNEPLPRSRIVHPSRVVIQPSRIKKNILDSELLLNEISFQNLVAHILSTSRYKNYMFDAHALKLIQLVSEMYLRKLFNSANICKIYTGRKTLYAKDFNLLVALKKHFVTLGAPLDKFI